MVALASGVALLVLAYVLAEREWDTGVEASSAADPTFFRNEPMADPVAAESTYRAMLDRPASAAEDLLPRLHYNLGTSLLLQRRYEEARPHLEMAGGAPGIVGVATAYNLGNADLVPAFLDPRLPAREDRLRRAITAYKAALLADPADLDAKWNLELAQRLLERDSPPAGGGGGSGGGDGPPLPGDREAEPSAGSRAGPQPGMSEGEAEELLRAAQEREQQIQRDRLRKPQPPGPIRP